LEQAALAALIDMPRRIDMRRVTLLSILLLAGCASGGEEKVTSEKVSSASREVPIDSSNIVDAQRAGYKVVNEDGKTLYCKRNLNTGSHLRYTTSCLTEEEWRDLADTSQRGVDSMRRDVHPPNGT
jgi:hypothetical protein